MSGRKITKADLEALRAGVVFARDEAEQASAQRELDLTKALVAATTHKPPHRPTNREAKKAAARRFVNLMRERIDVEGVTIENWELRHWDRKDNTIGAWAKTATGNERNASHAFDALLDGAAFLVEDRLLDDEPLDEWHLLKAVELIEHNRRTKRRR